MKSTILRYINVLVLLMALLGIGYGFYVMEEQPATAHKCIGGGTALLFLIAMPLFLFRVSRGKQIKDYMLNEENIKKMREVADKKERTPKNDR